MENKLERLLNTLLQRGWKPYEYQTIERVKRVGTLGIMFITKYNEEFSGFNIRMLTSRESLLRQFVCENRMVKRKRQGTNRQGGEPENCFNYENYEYRLIESALKDEEELEDFLLQNINQNE